MGEREQIPKNKKRPFSRKDFLKGEQEILSTKILEETTSFTIDDDLTSVDKRKEIENYMIGIDAGIPVSRHSRHYSVKGDKAFKVFNDLFVKKVTNLSYRIKKHLIFKTENKLTSGFYFYERERCLTDCPNKSPVLAWDLQKTNSERPNKLFCKNYHNNNIVVVNLKTNNFYVIKTLWVGKKQKKRSIHKNDFYGLSQLHKDEVGFYDDEFVKYYFTL